MNIDTLAGNKISMDYRGNSYYSLPALLSENNLGLSFTEIFDDLRNGLPLDVVLGEQGKYYSYKGVYFDSLDTIYSSFDTKVSLEEFKLEILNGNYFSSLFNEQQIVERGTVVLDDIEFSSISDAYRGCDYTCSLGVFKYRYNHSNTSPLLPRVRYTYKGINIGVLTRFYKSLNLFCSYRTFHDLVANSKQRDGIFFPTASGEIINLSDIQSIATEGSSSKLLSPTVVLKGLSRQLTCSDSTVRNRLSSGWSAELVYDYYSRFPLNCTDFYLKFCSLHSVYNLLKVYHGIKLEFEDFKKMFQGGNTLETIVRLYRTTPYKRIEPIIIGNKVYKNIVDLNNTLSRLGHNSVDELTISIMHGVGLSNLFTDIAPKWTFSTAGKDILRDSKPPEIEALGLNVEMTSPSVAFNGRLYNGLIELLDSVGTDLGVLDVIKELESGKTLEDIFGVTQAKSTEEVSDSTSETSIKDELNTAFSQVISNLEQTIVSVKALQDLIHKLSE